MLPDDCPKIVLKVACENPQILTDFMTFQETLNSIPGRSADRKKTFHLTFCQFSKLVLTAIKTIKNCRVPDRVYFV